MKELLGSKIKVGILVYLGLRGGGSGRHLAEVLKRSPSQIFKALHALEKGKIIRKEVSFYRLNPYYLYYKELLNIIHKNAARHSYPFLPKIPLERKVDPIAVYELLNLRGPTTPIKRLSDRLRELYA